LHSNVLYYFLCNNSRKSVFSKKVDLPGCCSKPFNCTNKNIKTSNYSVETQIGRNLMSTFNSGVLGLFLGG